MVGVSVIQVANAMRHTPLPPLLPETENGPSSEDLPTLTNGSFIQGGFVGGGQLAWRAVGPTVEIIQTSTGLRRAAFRFGKILHKFGARVTSVCGVGRGSVSQVVVGVDLGPDANPQGMVALLSLHTSTLTRAFHFAQKVTGVCMVSGGEVAVDKGTLMAELQTWKGILVVGTGHGTLHILDLALDLDGNKVLSDEVSPGSLTRVVTPDPCADQTRRTIIRQGSHPTMCLSGSDGTMGSGHFQLMGPDGNVLFEAPSHLAAVTSLAFFPQLASLAVGYGFGSFQIINLSTLTNDCTSPYEANVPPVLSFACQEPENDPKNFVYLWLCRSYDPAESRRKSKSETPALCTMYAMSYDKKVWIEGHGLWYQGLTSISPRFEFDAIGGLGLRGQPVNPSLVFCGTSVRHATHFAAVSASVAAAVGSVSALSTPDEDGGLVPEQSLCMFGWVGGILEQGHITINHYLAVFDINQWYQAQMPASLKVSEQQLCPYMSFHQLNRVPGSGAGVGQGEVVLAASPKQGSWARLLHTTNDTDWYPAALTYDAHLLTSEGLLEYECPSAQKAALAFLTQQGPSSVVSPEDAYAHCVFAGLLPTDSISSTPTAPSAMVSEREALLNVALDQHQMYFLLQCVAEFAEGHFTSLGCSLPALLDWAWGRVCTIKAANDTLCMPLFDPDCGAVGTEDIKILHRNVARLTSLTKIITTIRDYAHTNLITLQGAGELDSRVQVVCLLRQHLEAVLWFYHCGLLAPSPSDDLPEEQSVGVTFPADLLTHIYHNRRSEIQRLSSALKGDEILMIDGLLEEAGIGGCNNGSVVGQAWEKEGGNCLYPPPSLHSLLSTFLLPDVATTTKHRIVQYLFLDLASLLTDGYVRVVEELVKYPSSFSVSPSLIKLTQGFWLLDHKDFQEALNVLLDPLVNPQDLTPWQHRRIMKAFFFQGEAGLALRYATFRKPPKEDQDDIRLHLTLLLANGLVREAYHYQQTYRGTNIAQDLLNHFFHGCEELGKMESVIRLPLCPMEQDALVAYLNASSNPKAPDYLLVYYLLRDKYEQAARLQDKITREGLGINKKRQAARSALVHAYLTYLPHVAAKLSSSSEMKPNPVSITYSKPQPLSATIRQAATNEKTQASLIAKTFNTPKQQSHLNPFTPFRNASKRKRPQAVESSDSGIIYTPKPKPRDASRVVFPTQLESSQSSFFLGKEEEGGKIESSGLLFSPTPAKRRRTSEVSLLGTETRSLVNSVIKRCLQGPADTSASTSQIVSADMLSLLQTPKIKNKKKPTAIPAAETSFIDTPQSILKVRQMVQRPHSPSAASDVSVPVFPKFSAKKPSVAVPDDILASKQCDTSMTPKQLRFHLPKTQGDDQARKVQVKKDGGVKVADEIDHPTRCAEAEDWEEIQEVEEERLNDAMAEDKKERISACPQPSLPTLTTNPLRHPDSGVATPRLPLHPEGDRTRSSFHQRSISVDEVNARDENPEDQESSELHSRESSTNEMFFSFEEEEGEEERKETRGSRVLRAEKLAYRLYEESEEESEARDEMVDNEEKSSEVRNDVYIEMTDDESIEVPSVEKSKEVEDSEEDTCLDNQDKKEKGDNSQTIVKQGILDVGDSEFECISELSQEPVEDMNISSKSRPVEFFSRDTSIFDKLSRTDIPVASEMYKEISQQNVSRKLTQNSAEPLDNLSVSQSKLVSSEIQFSQVRRDKDYSDVSEDATSPENEFGRLMDASREISVLEDVTRVESQHVTVSSTVILGRKPISAYRDDGSRLSLSANDAEEEFGQESMKVKNDNELRMGKVVAATYEEKDDMMKEKYERENVLLEKEQGVEKQENVSLEKVEVEDILSDKEQENDVYLEKEKVEGILIENEQKEDVLSEKEEIDALLEEDRQDDILPKKEKIEVVLLEKEGEQSALLEKDGGEGELVENEEGEEGDKDAMSLKEGGNDYDGLIPEQHTLSPREEEMIAEAVWGGQGGESNYLTKFNTSERFSPICFSDSESEIEEEQEETVKGKNVEEKQEEIVEGSKVEEEQEEIVVGSKVEEEQEEVIEHCEVEEEQEEIVGRSKVEEEREEIVGRSKVEEELQEEIVDCSKVEEEQEEIVEHSKVEEEQEEIAEHIKVEEEQDEIVEHSNVEEEQEAIVECNKDEEGVEDEVNKKTSYQSKFSSSEQFNPLHFSDSENENEEERDESADHSMAVDVVEVDMEDIAREKMEKDTGDVQSEAKEKYEYTDRSFKNTVMHIEEAVPVTVSDSSAEETAKHAQETVPSTFLDNSSTETPMQIKQSIPPTTPKSSSRKTAKQKKEALPPTTPMRKTRRQSMSGTPDKTYHDPETIGHSSSTPSRRSRRLGGTVPATAITSGTAPEISQDSEATYHSSSTPLRRSRRLSGTSPATPRTSKTSKDFEAKEHSSSTPVRQSQRLSEASTASPVDSSATNRKPRAATSDKEGEEYHELRVETITRSGRKMHQVPTPVLKSRPSTPAAVATTPVRRSKRLSKGTSNEPSTPSSVTATPVRRSKRVEDYEAVEKVTLKLELSPGDSSPNPSVVLHDLSPDMIPSPPVSPSGASKKEKNMVSATGKTTPTKSSAKKHTRKSIIDDTLETILEEDGSHSVTNVKQKTPEKSTPTKLTNTKSKRSSRRSIGVMETISENSELSLVENIAQPSTPTTASRSSSRPSRVDIRESASDSLEMATTSQRRRRSSGVTPQIKTPQKSGKTTMASDIGLTTEKEVPSPSKRKNITESASRMGSVARRARRHSQSEEEKSVTYDQLPADANEISPVRTPGRSARSSSVTSLKESESSAEEAVSGRKHVGDKRQVGQKQEENEKVIEPAATEFSGRRKSRRLTVGSTSITTTLEHVPRVPYKALKSLKVYSDPDASSSSSVASPDLPRRHSRHSKKASHPDDTSILVLSPGEDEMILDGGLDTKEEPVLEESEALETPETPLRLLDIHISKKDQHRIRRFRQNQGRTSTDKRKRMTFGNTLGRTRVRSLRLYSDSLKDEEDIMEPSSSKKSRRSQKSKRKSVSTSVLEIEPEAEPVVESDKLDVEKEQQMENKKSESNSAEDNMSSSSGKTEATKEDPVLQFHFAHPKSVTSNRRIRALESLTSEAVEFLFSPPLPAGRIVKQDTKAKEGAPSSSTHSDDEEERERLDSMRSQQK